MIRQCAWFLRGLVQTLIQLETFSFTPTGARVCCTGCGVDLQHLRLSLFLNMLNSDDKTVSKFARTSLFLDVGATQGSATTEPARFPKSPQKIQTSAWKDTGSAGCVRFSQTDLCGGTGVLLWTE